MTDCKGLVYKASVRDFIDNRERLAHVEELTLMKRISCKCAKCLAKLEQLKLDYSHHIYPNIDEPLQHKHLYVLKTKSYVIDGDSVMDFYFEPYET